jgi:long-chain acyl-CoA synthetase
VTFDPALIEKRPRSLVHMFLQRVEETPEQDAFYYPVEGGWQESSWAHTHELVGGLAAGLVALGLEPEDRVAIVASTRYEWTLMFLAALWTGAAVTAVEPSAGDDMLADVLADSGARVVVSEDRDVTHALRRVRGRIRDVVKVVQIDGDFPDARVLTLEGLLAVGRDHLAQQPRALSQRLYAVRRDGLAAVWYVRDDDGGLRGVRLSHAALTYQAVAVSGLGELSDSDLVYAPLSLATAYAQTLLAVQLACGFPVALEGRRDQAVDSLAFVRPTVVAATPDLLAEVQDRIEGHQQGGLLRRRRTIDKRVRAEVQATFGDRLRFVVCGGGSVDADRFEFFAEAGVVVLEAYGRAEAGGAVSLAVLGEQDSRTAGRPLPGTEVRISDVGEIEISSPSVMEGYHRRAADSAAVLARGWLRTGDAGSLDDLGRVRFYGRHASRRSDLSHGAEE